MYYLNVNIPSQKLAVTVTAPPANWLYHNKSTDNNSDSFLLFLSVVLKAKLPFPPLCCQSPTRKALLLTSVSSEPPAHRKNKQDLKLKFPDSWDSLDRTEWL